MFDCGLVGLHTRMMVEYAAIQMAAANPRMSVKTVLAKSKAIVKALNDDEQAEKVKRDKEKKVKEARTVVLRNKFYDRVFSDEPLVNRLKEYVSIRSIDTSKQTPAHHDRCQALGNDIRAGIRVHLDAFVKKNKGYESSTPEIQNLIKAARLRKIIPAEGASG